MSPGIGLVLFVAVAMTLCGCADSSSSSRTAWSRTAPMPSATRPTSLAGGARRDTSTGAFDMGTLSLVVVKMHPEAYPAQESLRERFLSQFMHEDRSLLLLGQLTTEGWKRKYDAFSQELVRGAAEQGLGAKALAGILQDIQVKRAGGACVPVRAYQTALNGEPVWIIVLLWETEYEGQPPQPMGHICVYAFTQQPLRQVGYVTCN